MRRPLLIALLFLFVGSWKAPGQELSLVINADAPQDTISRHIYGHFAEHLGRDIYGGFWVEGEDGQWQYNEGVIEALRAISVPNLRWPGGCFADYYRWQDGIGAPDKRPTVVNTIWGGITEDNSFGTHEFMELTERLDTEPVVVGNVGSGRVAEMANWWEYMNHPGGSPMADLRAEHGREEPWNVTYWGVGNESWGCGGSMSPEYYANLYKRFATFLRPMGDTEPFRIATGPSGDTYEWTEVLMREAGSMIDGLDLHHYTFTGTWEDKGRATEFTEAEWFEMMQRTLQMEELITRHSAIMDQHDPEKRVALIVGEWGAWHRVERGTNPGFLYQQNALRDALVASVTLDIFNRHADRVRMANIAQTVNVLQAMILTEGTDGGDLVLTPTYHVFDLYQGHHDAAQLPVSLQAGEYTRDGESIPAVSASASQKDGRMHLTLTNMDPNASRTMRTSIRGEDVSAVTGRILTAGTMNAHNTFEAPSTVAPASFDDARLDDGDTLTIELPPKSIVALELE